MEVTRSEYLGDGGGQLSQDSVNNLVIAAAAAAECRPRGLGAKKLGLGEIQGDESGEDNLRISGD